MEESEKEKIKGSETLILNALRHKKHLSHFTLKEATDLVQELQISQAYFTHVSHQLGRHQEINGELPNAIELAYDGMQLSFG